MLSTMLLAQHALARNTEYHLKIEDVLRNPAYQEKLGKGVAFFFGAEKTPAIQENFGEFVTNKKTNSFGKPDEDACQWAMLSALLELRERALKMGGNAVVDIVSYYKKDVFESDSDYECHAGGLLAGVALKGNVVKLRN
jgi:uncharacterized protein YbjQ (UPF0145 family)